jgi:hypothetical protein
MAMTRLRYVLLCICVLLPASTASAQNQCTVNGCGPDGFIGSLVPDRFFRLCVFKECCNSHDKCYARCLDCGDLHGSPACSNASARAARKATCDEALYDDINRLNNNSRVCKGFAYAYWVAVRMAGDGYFMGRVLSLQAKAKFRSDFDAALAFYEFKSARGQTEDLAQSRIAIAALSRLDGIEQNKLSFEKSDGQGALAVESRSFPRDVRVTPPGEQPLKKQKFLNGLDISRMEYNGQRFELDDALPALEAPDIDIRSLQQIEKFAPLR